MRYDLNEYLTRSYNPQEMSSKFNFTLKNIDHKNIIERYSLYITNDEKKSGITHLSEINVNQDTNTFIKMDKKYSITMLDYLLAESLPEKTDIHCFWCRHSFSTIPIGCPIKYIPRQLEKNYFSEIHKENYTILHNVSSKIPQENKENHTENRYETDGIFCSFSCCLSFIYDNIKNPIYSQSQCLLGKLYTELYEAPPWDIKPAPHWRLLKRYGGSMTIEEYRDRLSKITYDFCGRLREIPKSKTIGWIFAAKN
jgi:hypothetical protein